MTSLRPTEAHRAVLGVLVSHGTPNPISYLVVTSTLQAFGPASGPAPPSRQQSGDGLRLVRIPGQQAHARPRYPLQTLKSLVCYAAQPLLGEHLLQDVKCLGQRGRAHPPQTFDQSATIDRPYLIEYDESILLLEAAGDAEWIAMPTGCH